MIGAIVGGIAGLLVDVISSAIFGSGRGVVYNLIQGMAIGVIAMNSRYKED